MGRGRIARVVVLAAALGWLTTGTATAAPLPPPANAAFVQAGVQVYPLDAVGHGCRVLGVCDGAAAALADTGIPRYLSTRAGEAVVVECRSDDVARVRGFFDAGQDTVAGWANASRLQMRGAPVGACGLLG